MTDKTIDRIALAQQASTIEAAGGDWTIYHVMAILDCARSTVYETPWLRRCAKRVGKRGLRFDPKKVRAGDVKPAYPLRRTGS